MSRVGKKPKKKTTTKPPTTPPPPTHRPTLFFVSLLQLTNILLGLKGGSRLIQKEGGASAK